MLAEGAGQREDVDIGRELLQVVLSPSHMPGVSCCKRASTPTTTSRKDLPILPSGAFESVRCTFSTSKYSSRACEYSPCASARRALVRSAVMRRSASAPEQDGAASSPTLAPAIAGRGPTPLSPGT